MKRQLAVFASDQVNLQNSRIPAAALMDAEERIRFARLAQGLPAGLPTHIQHDMHRLIGWSHVLGHLVDGAMVRTIGMAELAETDAEKAQLQAQTDKFWAIHHEEGMEEFKVELLDKVQPHALDESRYLRIEAFVVSRPGLAAELYPELFDLTADAVDKDGLTDYRVLTKRMKMLHPGVFLDEEKGLVIFAHRFFRRSMSHRNKLNDYFLHSFDKVASELPHLRARLRLDPDLVGHPATVQHLLELEHWHGPKFSDDIESIPTGATEHKAQERVMYFEGVDKTHFWWKTPESRKDKESGNEEIIRTFEVEELIENESHGLVGERFGCRYAHAEFSPEEKALIHFDGAIRAYPAEAYLERIDKTIDHAGKHSEYTKLFRFDKALPVEVWKRLLNDYFRGNPLVPEYLEGMKPQAAGTERAQASAASATAVAVSASAEEPEELCAFISIALDKVDKEFILEADDASLPLGIRTDTVETGCGATDEFLRSRIDLESVIAVGSTDGALNLARMGFGGSATFPALMLDTVAGVTRSLAEDIGRLELKKISVAMSWPLAEMMVTLSLRGKAELVVQALGALFTIVDPTKLPSQWIEQLSELVKALAPRTTPTDELWGVPWGVVSYLHSEEEPYRMFIPDALVPELVARRVIKVRGRPE